jgi:hypothetical protein
MPIRRRPASWSMPLRSLPLTRSAIQPTVDHEILINSATAVLLQCTASQLTWSSNERVLRAPWSAHGTCATRTPCSRQRTRGDSASTKQRVDPRSRARHRRLPSPWSYSRARLSQTPQRRRCPRRKRTPTTRSSPSKATPSTIAPSIPSSRAYKLGPRTPFPPRNRTDSTVRNRIQGRRALNSRSRRYPPTETAGAPEMLSVRVRTGLTPVVRP